MNTARYVLKIELDNIEPQIWRRFAVPAEIPLDRLHDVIQIIMGWQDYHLHEFTINDTRYVELEQYDDIWEDERPAPREEGLFTLKRLIKRKNVSFKYVYDFGDDWTHTLIVEETRAKMGRDDEPIQCLEGYGACPPEDVGGDGGYYKFRQIMADPEDEEHEEYKTWYGKPFDPAAFDKNKINMDLLWYMRWSRVRPMSWDPHYGC